VVGVLDVDSGLSTVAAVATILVLAAAASVHWLLQRGGRRAAVTLARRAGGVSHAADIAARWRLRVEPGFKLELHPTITVRPRRGVPVRAIGRAR